MKKFDAKKIFPKEKDLGFREWGSETLVALIPNKISLKVLHIKKGMRGGLQFHHKKNECGYLVSGSILIRYDTGNGKLRQKKLKSGKSFHFPPKLVHQEEALTDCIIIEASTPFYNDRVRVEKKYGKNRDGGLPSTTRKQVKQLKLEK